MPIKKSISLFLCIFLVHIAMAQKVDYSYNDKDKRNTFFGSAKDLFGKTLVVNCFVSTEKQNWTLAEKQDILVREKEGFAWLQNEANKWNVTNLTFTAISLGLKEDIKLDKIESFREPQKKVKVNITPIALNKMGYYDLYFLYDSLLNSYRADNVVVITYVKQIGRSYAQPANTNYKQNDRFLESAIVYSDGYNNKEVTSATIIHEMLHLFGARDIYKGRGATDEIEQKMSSVFPTSIMIQTHTTIWPLRVEQLTAWCIGWTKRYWAWYDLFGNNK